MKIYHTQTQEDYDALMKELEKQGVLWIDGMEPTSDNCWRIKKENTTIYLRDDKEITCDYLTNSKNKYPNTPIQIYKAKKDGEANMKIYHTQTQEDYDALMNDLEEQGIFWQDDTEPNEFNFWGDFKENTCIKIDNGLMIYNSKSHFEKSYPDTPIKTYKAKWGYKVGEYACMPTEEASERVDDKVSSSSHYIREDIELIDFMEGQMTADEFMGYLKGNVTKYNYRELDENQDEDIERAEWYQKKLREFVSKGKTILSRVAKRFNKATGYEFDDEFIDRLEKGELKIVEVAKEENE